MKDPLDGLDRDKGYPFDRRDSDIRESGASRDSDKPTSRDSELTSRDSDKPRQIILYHLSFQIKKELSFHFYII